MLMRRVTRANMQHTHHIKGSNMLSWFGVVGVLLGEVRGSVTSFGIYIFKQTDTNINTACANKVAPKHFT